MFQVFFSRIAGSQHLSDHVKPFYSLIMDIIVMTIPIYRLDFSRLEFWMASLEALA
jgi:hypothetical protein